MAKGLVTINFEVNINLDAANRQGLIDTARWFRDNLLHALMMKVLNDQGTVQYPETMILTRRGAKGQIVTETIA